MLAYIQRRFNTVAIVGAVAAVVAISACAFLGLELISRSLMWNLFGPEGDHCAGVLWREEEMRWAPRKRPNLLVQATAGGERRAETGGQ